MLKTVKLTTKQGTTWTTSVNGQLDNKELINDIKKHGLLPEWLKNESQILIQN